MKRRDLLAAMTQAGFVLLRDQGGHTVFQCPCGKHRAAVPRHREVKAPIVRQIRVSPCLPKGWLP